MEPVTIRIPTEQLNAVDTVVEQQGYGSRAEFIREAIREGLADGG